MKKINLYKYHVDCGRMGEISGLFTATEEEAKSLVGGYAYFGEVLGKHSEISGEIEADEITLVSDDQEFVQKAIEAGLGSFGHNPIDAIEEAEA